MRTGSTKVEPPSHRATTAHLQAAYPFMTDAGLGHDGAFLGKDLLGGGPFCFDPWTLYARGVLTNPNLIVVGQIGRGKSTFVKTYVWRQLALGRQAWIIDPKGEYGQLAQAVGVEPLKMEPGGSVRLNPLEISEDTTNWSDVLGQARRRADLICSLAESSLHRTLSPAERTATELAVRSASTQSEQPTLADVVAFLFNPPSAVAVSVHCDTWMLAEDGRAVALELRRLIEGDLVGMFDGRTSSKVDLSAPVVVIDLSQVYSSPALPLIMTCATGWMQSALVSANAVKRILVVDEAWAVLHEQATARWLQATFKLSRSLGVSNVAVVHRVSDLRAVGQEGSVPQSLSTGLLADSEVRVIFGQPASEAEATSELLSLSHAERDAVASLPRGVSLWKVGERSFLVEHLVGEWEAGLVDTDAAMRER